MKPGLFSFIGDEFENVFHYSDLFLPGIERIVGIYFSRKLKQIQIISRKRDDGVEINFDEFLQSRENMVMIQRFISAPLPFTWIKKDEIPFDINAQKKILTTSDLFSELEKVILVLRFKIESDQMNDLLLIYFNHNLGNFGLAKSEKVLSSENKTIIGHLLYYQFKSYLMMNLENRKLLNTLHHVLKGVIQENSSIKAQLNHLQASYGENIVNMANQILVDLSGQFERTFLLDDEATEKIREYKGNLKHLPGILRNAVIFTENLLSQDDDDPVTLFSYTLDFESYQVVEKTELSTRKIDSRQSRAMIFLDRLERAAQLLKAKNQPLISAKIGQAMEPAVSAPAISDALGKMQEILPHILEQYPDKWELIRKDFKPLRNKIDKKDVLKEEVESA